MNNSLTFEEIQIGEWYWDDASQIYFECIDKREYKKTCQPNLFNQETSEKIQEVVRVYPKNAKYGEYIKFSPKRFYKHKEDVDRLE